MTLNPNRRGLLRGLAGLPLIGGSVVLIGQPTRTAQPATPEQLAQYACFSLNECQLVMCDLQARGLFEAYPLTMAMDLHRASFPGVDGLSSRAPVMLSAAGLSLAGQVA